jgi:hypothetical protein
MKKSPIIVGGTNVSTNWAVVLGARFAVKKSARAGALP